MISKLVTVNDKLCSSGRFLHPDETDTGRVFSSPHFGSTLSPILDTVMRRVFHVSKLLSCQISKFNYLQGSLFRPPQIPGRKQASSNGLFAGFYNLMEGRFPFLRLRQMTWCQSTNYGE